MSVMQIVDIYNRVDAAANEQTAQIIRDAWDSTYIDSCDQCSYPENQQEYGALLAAKRDKERVRRGITFVDKWYYSWYWSKQHTEMEREGRELSAELRKIAPCVECRKRYNPHGKMRYYGENRGGVIREASRDTFL